MTTISSPAEFETLFRKIWTVDVKERYEKGVLNSERALQACIVGALVKGAPDLVVLVEPTLYTEAGSKAGREMIPDLWIGDRDSRSALAVVELKFVPFHYPKWEYDIKKLVKILGEPYYASTIVPATGTDDHDVRIRVRNEPGHETLGVFAAIGKEDAEAVDMATLRKKFPGGKNLLPRFSHAWGKIPLKPDSDVPNVEGFGIERLAAA